MKRVIASSASLLCWSAFGVCRVRAGLSEPHRHDHRAVSGRRPDRPARARAGAEIFREARAELHRREHQRRRHHHRDRTGRARGAKTATRCCCTTCRSRRMSRSIRSSPSTPRRTSRRSPSSTRTRWCWSGASRSRPNTLPELLAAMKKTAGANGASRHRLHRPSRHLAARQGGRRRGRARALSRRGAGAAGYRRRPCRSVLRDAAVGGADGCRRTDEGLRHHVEGDVAAVPERARASSGARSQARDPLLARAVRAGWDPEAGHRPAQRRAAAT